MENQIHLKYSYTNRQIVKKDKNRQLFPNQSITKYDDHHDVLITIVIVDVMKYASEISKSIREDTRSAARIESYTFSRKDTTILTSEKKVNTEMFTFEGTEARMVFFHDMVHIASFCQYIFKSELGISLYWARKNNTCDGTWIPIVSFQDSLRKLAEQAYRFGITSSFAEAMVKIEYFISKFVPPPTFEQTKRSAQPALAYKLAERASEKLHRNIRSSGLGDMSDIIFDFARQQMEEKMLSKKHVSI
jgi:hypothetical protein